MQDDDQGPYNNMNFVMLIIKNITPSHMRCMFKYIFEEEEKIGFVVQMSDKYLN